MDTTLALMFVAVSQSFSLPTGLLSAVCWQESHHDTSAMHFGDGGSTSHGACQVKESTARFMGFRGKVKDLRRPETNVFYAGAYLRYQLDRYHGNAQRAIAAYNSGTYKAGHRGHPVNYHYVQEVMRAWKENR